MGARWAIDGIALVSRSAELIVLAPGDAEPATFELSGPRVTVGRLAELNDIALEPDPELLVTRAEHFALEPEGALWAVVDGGSVNGTFLRRGGELRQVTERTVLHDGDVICVLASIAGEERRYFELAFHAAADSQATRAVPETPATECLSYDPDEARLVLVQGGERHELQIRAQAHKL